MMLGVVAVLQHMACLTQGEGCSPDPAKKLHKSSKGRDVVLTQPKKLHKSSKGRDVVLTQPKKLHKYIGGKE